VLAEALAGERPFRGASLGELRRAIARGPELAGVPRHLRAVVRRGLAEVAADRFSSMDALLDAIIRARRRPRRIAAAIGAGVVVLGLVGWATLRGERAEPCPDATPRLAGVWDAPTQSAIERAFLATGAPYAADAWRGTQPVLDRYAQAWVAMHRESCLATAVRHEQSADLLDRRTACLARRANELRALTALFGHADATAVEHAVSAANMLTPIDDCSGRDVTASRSDPVALAVERALADVKARWTAGSVASADAELEQLVRDARALRDPTLLARTLLQRGLWQRDLAPTAGQPVLREAARVAEAAGLDAVKADALIGIVGALGVTFEGATLAEALAVADDARATLQRIGGDPAREAHLEEAVCDVYEAAGKVADAQACATHALTIVAPDRRAAVEVTLGTILHDLGRLADSRAHYARALALVEERSGPHHPDIAVVLHDRALDFQEEGKLDEARADFERSLAILEAAYGRDAAPVAQSLAGLGNTLEYQGDHATALRHLTRARAIYVRIRGTEDVGILDGIGRVERALGHFAAAQALHEQALALRRAELGPEDADVAISHENLGQLFEVQKRYQLALAHYREALRIHEKALGSDSPLVALDKKLIRDVEGR